MISEAEEEKIALRQQKIQFEWKELMTAAHGLLPDEVPVVTEYIKRFIDSRPEKPKPIGAYAVTGQILRGLG